MEYGRLHFTLNELLEKKGISKNRICRDLDIPRTNLNRYCKDEFQRIDSSLICKLCGYLDIEVGDLIVYRKQDNNV